MNLASTDRADPRHAIDSDGRAFVGTREDLSGLFDYFVRDVSAGGVGFAVNDDVGLAEGERVNFHLPFRVNEEFHDQGTLRWRRRAGARWECGASLEGRIPLYYPVYIAFEEGRMAFHTGAERGQRLVDILRLLVKDAWLLKRGVGVYFDHLAPYFRRLAAGRAEPGFAETVRARMDANVARLAALRARVEDSGFRARTTDGELAEFRAAIEPELRPEEFYERFQTAAVLPYLKSIQRLEYRLYMNFNSAVLLSQENDRRQAEFRSRQGQGG